MNQQLYELIEDACWAQVENNAEFKEALAKHNAGIKHIKEKLGVSSARKVEDSLLVGGSIYGRAMFEMGLKLGRNPAAIFDLSLIHI